MSDFTRAQYDELYLKHEEEVGARSEPSQRLLCAICLELLHRPLLTPCGHTFCEGCLQECGASCPTCRGSVSIDACSRNHVLEDIIEEQTFVKCWFPGCSKSLHPRDEAQHLRDCNFRLVECERGCKLPIFPATETNRHDERCEMVQVPCQFRGCRMMIVRKNLQVHELGCDFRTKVCRGCSTQLTAGAVKEHESTCIEVRLADLEEEVASLRSAAKSSTRQHAFNLRAGSGTVVANTEDLSGLNLRGMPLSGSRFAEANLSGADLRGANLQGSYLQGANLAGANLQGANLKDAILRNADLRGFDLRSTNFDGADMQYSDFEGADLKGANFAGAKISNCNFKDANLENAVLKGSQLNGSNFQGANLKGASFGGLGGGYSTTPTDLLGANLQGAKNLQGIDFESANLGGCDLHGASLQGANFQGANLQGANLQDANLQGADLKGAKFQRANLQRANLQGTDFGGHFRHGNSSFPNFEGADLPGANLQSVNLHNTNLKDANLKGANLKSANLQSAKLEGADFDGADLTGANLAHNSSRQTAKNLNTRGAQLTCQNQKCSSCYPSSRRY